MSKKVVINQAGRDHAWTKFHAHVNGGATFDGKNIGKHVPREEFNKWLDAYEWPGIEKGGITAWESGLKNAGGYPYITTFEPNHFDVDLGEPLDLGMEALIDKHNYRLVPKHFTKGLAEIEINIMMSTLSVINTRRYAFAVFSGPKNVMVDGVRHVTEGVYVCDEIRLHVYDIYEIKDDDEL